MTLGEVLREWRVAKELTIRRAAKEIGVPYSTLSRVERGEAMDGATLAKVLTWLLTSNREPRARHQL